MERRKFLVGGGALLGLAGMQGFSNPSLAQASALEALTSGKPIMRLNDADPRPLPTASNDLTPYKGTWGDVQIRHALRRAMFGVPQSQFLAAKALGSMDALINKLIDPNIPLPTKPAPWVDEILKADRTLPQDQQQLDALNKQRLEAIRANQLVNWWFDQILQENLSIREKMTLMWSNHFVIGSQAVKATGYLYQYNQTLRKNALGNLKQFAYDVSVDPGMLVYLNGNQSFYKVNGSKVTNNVNENYARELMELFTLGLLDPKTGEPNYTEADIQNAAQALSGWVPTTTAPFVGTFVSTRHNNGDKTFFGQTGNWGVQDIINMIFAKNGGYNTAYFFAEKIYSTFVYYVPNPAVVDAMANLLVQSNFEIVPVLKALFSSAHFYDENVISAQLKSPVEFGASLVREFAITYPAFDPTDPRVRGTDPKTGQNLYKDTNPTLTYLATAVQGKLLGQQLLDPPNVKGWPGGHNWISTGTYPTRKALSLSILTYPNIYNGQFKRAPGVTLSFDPQKWAHLVPGVDGKTSTEITASLSELTLSLPLGPNELNNLHDTLYPGNLPEYDFSLSASTNTLAKVAQAMATLPEFQLV